ncbi:MAG: hypothetical protein AAF539_04885 [Planctomycetota bacterium]
MLVPVALVIVADLRSQWTRSVAISQRVAAGLPVSIADLQPAPISDADNAAVALIAQEDDVGMPLGTTASADSSDPISDERGRRLRAAIMKPAFQWPLDDRTTTSFQQSVLEGSARLRAHARQLDGHARALQKRLDASPELPSEYAATYVTDVMSLHRLADHSAKIPTLVAYLTGCAIRDQAFDATKRVMNKPWLSSTDLKRMQDAGPGTAGLSNQFAAALDSEAAFALSMSQQGPWMINRFNGSTVAGYLTLIEAYKSAAIAPAGTVTIKPQGWMATTAGPSFNQALKSLRRLESKFLKINQP